MTDRLIQRDGITRRLRDVGDGVFAPELAVVEAAAQAADQLRGMLNAAGTLLTVPAGRTWRGHLQLSGSASAAVGAAAAVQSVRLELAGAGAAPAVGTLVELPIALPATAATATAGAAGRADVVIPVTIIAGAADAVVTLAATAGMTAVRAAALGQLG